MDRESIRRRFEDNHVRRVKLGAFDIDATLRGKYISVEKFWSAAESGLGFCDVIFGWDIGDVLYDNVKFTGWHTGYPDAHCRIDLSSYRLVPWEPGTAFFLLDFCDADGRRWASRRGRCFNGCSTARPSADTRRIFRRSTNSSFFAKRRRACATSISRR
jgi:glutamine synthetase